MTRFNMYDVSLLYHEYKPDNIVRVTVVIEDGADKNKVIELLCEKMKDEPSFDLHNTKLSENTFTLDIKYSLVDSLKEIEGVKEVTLTKRVNLHENEGASIGSESVEREEVKIQKEGSFFSDFGTQTVIMGVAVVLVVALIVKKVHKK